MSEERGMQANDPLTGRSEFEYQKQVRDLYTMKSEGPKLFQRLQEYLVSELRDANRRAGKNEFRLLFLKSRPLDLFGEKYIRVERPGRNFPPLTITYLPYIHDMHFECGAKKCEYKLVVGDDGNLWLETCDHIRKTIEEVGTEMLKEFDENFPR